MARFIRPSTTQSTAALWAKSVLDTVLFLGIAMIGPLWLTDWVFPYRVPLPFWPRAIGSGLLFVSGIAVWAVCVDSFTRRGRGTAFPLDAPRHLVSTGPFAVVRNPIIVAEAVAVWGAALYLSSLGALLYATFFTLAGIASWSTPKNRSCVSASASSTRPTVAACRAGCPDSP